MFDLLGIVFPPARTRRIAIVDLLVARGDVGLPGKDHGRILDLGKGFQGGARFAARAPSGSGSNRRARERHVSEARTLGDELALPYP